MSDYRITEIELKYHFPKPLNTQLKIVSPSASEKIFRESWEPDTIEAYEQFKLMLLNGSNHLLGIAKIGQGGIGSVTVDLKILFGIAVKGHASTIVVAHNHPSDNCFPSLTDDEATRKIAACAKLLGMKLLDHLILTRDSYFSYSENGLIDYEWPKPIILDRDEKPSNGI